MGSYFRDFYSPTATQRPTVGDTKFSVINQDHMGWMKCDGRALSKTTYNILYQVVGDAFGSSATMFNLPNAVGRVPGAVGKVAVDDAGRTTSAVRRLGDLSGEEVHLLNRNEMPAHTHGSANVTGNNNGDGLTNTVGDHVHGIDAVDASLVVTGGGPNDDVVQGAGTTAPAGSHNHTIGSTGGGAVHNNMQPTIFIGNMFIFSGKVRPTADNYYPYTYRAPIF
jgi:microcystin-dependent protein